MLETEKIKDSNAGFVSEKELQDITRHISESAGTLANMNTDMSLLAEQLIHFSNQTYRTVNLLNTLNEDTEKLIAYSKKRIERESDDSDIRYWMYEFEMPLEMAEQIEAYCKKEELTMDEFFVQILKDAMDHPEFLKSADGEEIPDQDIKLIRTYPVHVNETEAQALKKAIQKEKREESNNEKTCEHTADL